MRIVVCIKPVRTEMVYKTEDRNEKYTFNPYDLYTLEQSLSLKKLDDSIEIIALSMGPMDAQHLLVKSLAMGCDDGIILNDSAFIGSDTLATSYVLATAIKKLNKVDLIVCGAKSIDGETGQVVFGIAERLNLNCIQHLKKVIGFEDDKLILEQENGDRRLDLSLNLPAVIAFKDFTLKQPDISLLLHKRAKQKGIKIWNADDIEADGNKIGNKGSKTKVIGVQNIVTKRERTIVNGSIADKAKYLTELLSLGSNIKN